MLLEGEVALITGAGRNGKGIGRSIALKLASEGAKICIVDYNVSDAELVAKEVMEAGGEAFAMQGSVAEFDHCEKWVDEVVKKWGKLDILVNNAGITRDNLILKMSDQEWDMVLSTNLKGVFNCTKAALNQMFKQRSGKIVNMASVMGIMGNPGQANYSASKGGVIALTKTTAKEYGKRGIRANAIAPGFIQTTMTEEMTEEAKSKVLDMIPMKTLGTPDDVANVALFLSSSLSSYLTGVVIPVDGGMAM
ncbi:MAG: 3-oxoacyl-[Abditibacteriota bacterium]|nr:3-oxoacyl-[acyl-carrier-protein] reductase [Abditibacteriota bacterium]